MGRQARAKRERKTTNAIVRTKAFDELTLADIDMMIIQLTKRRVTLIHEMKSPGIPIDHGSLTGYEGYTLGLDVYHAVADIAEAHLTLGWLLVEVIDVILSTEGLPSDWQLQILRNWFAQKAVSKPMDERLKDACYALRSNIDDLLPIVTMNGFALEMLVPDELITFANEVMRGIRRLMAENELASDNGETLREVVERYGGNKLASQLETMRENAPRIGRTKGAPVSDHIVERYHHYSQLGCKTRGEIYERICHELAQTENVKTWQSIMQNGSRQKDGGYQKYQLSNTLEVQAFIRLGEGKLGRVEGGNKLKEIKDNANKRKNRGQ